MLDSRIQLQPNGTAITGLPERLAPTLEWPGAQSDPAGEMVLGRHATLATWCDQHLGTRITDLINRELIKWCEAFLDEGHATWSMPGRERGFYRAWKFLAEREWSPCAIKNSQKKLARLPVSPEDALLENLTALGVLPEGWQHYLGF